MRFSYAVTRGVLVLLLVGLSQAHPISKSCESTCDFHLCSPAKLSLLSPPYSPVTPPICLEGRPVHVTSSGEAFVRSGASYYSLISRSAPSSDKRCAPNFFTTYPTASGAAAIGFQPSPSTDYSFLAGKCVSLPLNAVQLVSPLGAVLHEMELEGRPLKDCVGFQVDEEVPPPPNSPRYKAASVTPVAATPAPQRDDDVSEGGRSALEARKSIMETLSADSSGDDAKSTSAPEATSAPVATPSPMAAPTPAAAPTPVATSMPMATETMEEGSPMESASPVDEEGVSASQEPEVGGDEADESLFEAVPFSV